MTERNESDGMEADGGRGLLRTTAIDFLHYLLVRFNEDHCTRVAASLAYTTLLALVPLLALVFSTLAAVPAFSGWQSAVEGFIFDNFVPAFGSTVREYLGDFTGKARGLQAAGVVTLGVTVLMMMATIETAFNRIWRVKKRRPFTTRFLVYWAVLTLGPLLIGSGLVATSYVTSLPMLASVDETLGLRTRLIGAFPFLSTTLAFFLFFRLIPNRPVPRQHAAAGALVASLSFEAAKRGFAWYVTTFPGQEMIYGTFATLPLFLVWIYVSWLVVMVGAEVTVCLTTFNALAPRRHRAFARERFYAAWRVLVRLTAAQRSGRGLSEDELVAAEQSLPYGVLSEALERLADAGWLNRDEDYDWLLARDLHTLTVADLMQLVPPSLPVDGRLDLALTDAADERLATLFAGYGRYAREELSVSIASLCAPASDANANANADAGTAASATEAQAGEGEAPAGTNTQVAAEDAVDDSRDARRYLVSGRVQGVSYRASAAARADELGLCGWVRNLPDGRVEAHAEGPLPMLLVFEEWLAQGPPRAWVAAVDGAPAEDSGACEFRVRR